MTLAACAALVERGDPDRFLAVMAAPVHLRPQLLPLYAFNLEVARAPWVTEEPLIAEMRLQWWRDVVENAASGAARAHEVAGPLHDLIRDFGLPIAVLDRLIAARRWDIHREPHDSAEALNTYLEDTGAGLMWLAARALGAPDTAEAPLRAYGWAAAAAGYLRAVPALQARGRVPLPDGITPLDLARDGLARLATARAGRRVVPKAVAPALLAGWQAEPILRQVGDGTDAALGLSEFQRRGRLIWQAFTGRW
ncbi:squalene/phytoene synthase family protein [Tabrizicola sp.]|uniref:squalene/phytoene synthase family protein n=1 Tax=Tabrizicola sp. TaxID=2005166 RepID=UPI00263197C7|nr:squalene/phytoene synthase family protein [Tabrizicola sp.]MDM7930976.1 squalene/phytoene synthase family protein [Tabrizicola sp.]